VGDGATTWTLLAGSASGSSGSTATLLYYPAGLAVDSYGNLFVTDSGNARVQFFLAGSSTGTTVAGVTGSAGSSATQLNTPYGVAIDSQRNLYVADTYNYRVQKYINY
jgi:sugar lactone lactonase YvrE